MIHRRTFLRQLSLGYAGAVVTPFAPFDHRIVLGHNGKRYRLDTAWSKADVARYPVNDCHEMVQDQKGRLLLLTNETRNNILVYDKKGRILDSWGHDFPGGHGLTLFAEGGQDVLYICDNSRHQVIKTDLNGKVLLTLDYPKESGLYAKADEYIPTETAIAANGDIYVADGYGKDYIHRYNHLGQYQGYFGGRGTEAKHLLNAHGVCIDQRQPTPTLLVTSRQQHAFKRYSMDGVYLETIALPGAWVCRPVIKGDYLYAAVLQSDDRQWKQSGFLTILDRNNKVISNPGGMAPEYSEGALRPLTQQQPLFAYPHDVCVDDEENLYVAQWNSGKVYPYKLKPVA